MNCLEGIKDEPNDQGITRSMARRRKGSQAQQDYLFAGANGPKKVSKENRFPDNWINTNFRLRMMHGGKSFFLITDGGLTFEYIYAENLWLWLRHDHPTPMKGALGNYNGSLFLVDIYGSLLIRERSGEGLAWVNCTAMRNLGHVIGGPPWDGIPGKALKVTEEDAIFLVSKNGRLLQFTVSSRNQINQIISIGIQLQCVQKIKSIREFIFLLLIHLIFHYVIASSPSIQVFHVIWQPRNITD
jgi:hypothetical protein